MQDKIYNLSLNTERESDPAYDATLVPFEGSNKLVFYFTDPETYPREILPKEILFLANFNYISEYDFLFTDSGLFVISKKVLEIITKHSDVDYTTVPVILIDDTYLKKKFSSSRELLDDVPINRDYVALRLEQLESYFDFEASEYTPRKSNPKMPARIKKSVLRKPQTGFPHIFRTKEKASEIFVSQHIKEILEGSNIKGCSFKEIETTNYNNNRV